MPLRKVPLSAGVCTMPSLTRNRLALANSATSPQGSSTTAVTKPRAAASRNMRATLGYSGRALGVGRRHLRQRPPARAEAGGEAGLAVGDLRLVDRQHEAGAGRLGHHEPLAAEQHRPHIELGIVGEAVNPLPGDRLHGLGIDRRGEAQRLGRGDAALAVAVEIGRVALERPRAVEHEGGEPGGVGHRPQHRRVAFDPLAVEVGEGAADDGFHG